MFNSVLKRASWAIAMLASSGVHAQTSTFAIDTEGWTASGDTSGALMWVAAGGNPGGHIVINDSASGDVIYFIAPAAFLGDKSAAIGTNLTFDLQQVYPSSSPSQFDASDVILVGGGLTLAYDTPTNPANGSWTSYAVPLTAAGWHVGTLAGAAATATQFSTVMSSLTGLQIRAEYQSGADTDKLDNVSLAVPESATLSTLLAGLGVLLAWARQKRPSAK